MAQLLNTETGNVMQSAVVGAIATGVDSMYYKTIGNTAAKTFACSAGAEFFSENVDQMLFSQSMPGQSYVTQPVSSGLAYMAISMLLSADVKPVTYQFLQQVGSSIAGRYVSPGIRPLGSY